MSVSARGIGLLTFAAVGLAGGIAGCGNAVITNPSPNFTPLVWSQIGPQGGFVPSVAFDPARSGVAWASGDDGTGLYQSTNGGAAWAVVSTGSQSQSTYSLRFDPSNPSKIFAPNHFGRGMLRSTDGGATWTSGQAGLPDTGTATQLLWDIAVNPSNPNIVFAATDAGLYKSTDGGGSFTLQATSLAGTTGVRAVAYRDDGVLFIGKADGGMGYTPDSGATWGAVLAPSTISVAFIVFSSTSLYLGYANSAIYQLNKTSFAGGLINDPSVSTSILTTNRLAFAVKSGAAAATDLIYVGASGSSTVSPSRYGLFKSTNGGGSFTQITNGIVGNVASVAIDPANSNNVLAGSNSGYGIFFSTNGGASFTAVKAGLYATDSTALAQDRIAQNHFVASDTACGGFSLNFETTDGGTTWSSFGDPVVDDGVLAFDFDPSSSSNLLAGTCTKGIYRSTHGSAGPWTSVITTAGNAIDRFIHDALTPATVYAVVPKGDSSHSLYVSSNAGALFAPRTGVVAYDLAAHPANGGEAVIVNGSDAIASNDGFATQHALGLSSYASAEGGFTSVAFNPSTPNEVFVGGASGGIYRTTNYVVTGAGVGWTKLSTPIVGAQVRDLVVASRGKTVIYALTFGGDTSFTPSSTVGVFRSLDDGASWTRISDSVFPSALGWTLLPDARAPQTSFLMGMWSGGLFQLLDNE